MTNDIKPSREAAFGTRELRPAQTERPAAPAIDPDAPNPRDAGGGFDPYNSSGGFDRRKNWARVGKR